MAKEDTDLQKVKELIKIMEEKNLLEMEVKHGDDKIYLKRSVPGQSPAIGVPVIAQNIPRGTQPSAASTISPEAAQPSATKEKPSAPQQEANLVEIKSPLVGTFYAQPSPESEPYVEVGSQVGPKTVVCIIEAMKVMNEIKAEAEGTIVEILVKNGQAVEYGQALFKVKPA